MAKHIAYFAAVLCFAVAAGFDVGVIAHFIVLGMGFACWAIIIALTETLK